MAYSPYGSIKASFIKNDEKAYENLGITNANLISGDNEQIKRDVQTIHNFCKGIGSLTTMTYIDTQIEYSVSVNEIAADQGVDW